MKRTVLVGGCVIALASLVACGTSVGQRAATGGVAGAVVAGPIGAVVGGTAGAITN